MALATGMPHFENGVGLDLSMYRWFQFEGSNIHKPLQELASFKEMDFGFLDQHKKLFLVEIKDLSLAGAKAPTNKKDNYREEELLLKSMHSCLMIFALSNMQNPKLHGTIPQGFNTIKLIHILKVPKSKKQYLLGLSKSLKGKFRKFSKGYAMIESIGVFDYDTAKQKFSWVK